MSVDRMLCNKFLYKMVCIKCPMYEICDISILMLVDMVENLEVHHSSANEDNSFDYHLWIVQRFSCKVDSFMNFVIGLLWIIINDLWRVCAFIWLFCSYKLSRLA